MADGGAWSVPRRCEGDLVEWAFETGNGSRRAHRPALPASPALQEPDPGGLKGKGTALAAAKAVGMARAAGPARKARGIGRVCTRRRPGPAAWRPPASARVARYWPSRPASIWAMAFSRAARTWARMAASARSGSRLRSAATTARCSSSARPARPALVLERKR